MSSETLRNMLVKLEPRNVSCCYVCAGPRADYPLFSKPYGDRPFFPFLEHHNPPEGAENITIDGRVLVCSLCYAFLTQQWDSYERSKTPHSKRIYWLKRLDNGPFAGMEVNLQQDYESLFDASHGSLESEQVRSKHRSNRNSHTPTSEMKILKFPDRTESRDSSMSSKGEKMEVSEFSGGGGGNALDLSMPSRTPSQSSSTALSPTTELESCYVCGNASQIFVNVYVKPISNCPFFPSLLTHAKPLYAKPIDNSGKVHACESCHKSLLLQWDLFGFQNVPHSERSYKFHGSNISAKEDTTPTEKTFFCFTCGVFVQSSMKRELCTYPTKQGEPYFSFLTQIAPAPGAKALVNGKAIVCSFCYKSVYRQLRVFELSGIPEERRKYKIHSNSTGDDFSVLRQHLKGSTVPQKSVSHKNVCFLCDKMTDSLLPVSIIPNSHMYFPFIKMLNKPVNAEPPSADGCVKTCRECYASLKFQWDAFEHAKIPIDQRQYRITSPKPDSGKKSHMQNNEFGVPESNNSSFPLKKSLPSETCCLCLSTVTHLTMQWLDTLPRHNNMFFPFVRSYLKTDDHSQMDQYGRVIVCVSCYLLLKNQWDLFESASVPLSQRQYRFFMPAADQVPKLEPTENAISMLHVSSPEIKPDVKGIGNLEPILTTANTFATNNSVSSTASSHCSPQVSDSKALKSDDGAIRSLIGPLDAPLGRPLLMSTICYICAEPSTNNPMYAINTKSVDSSPFFPFVAKCPVPEGAEKLAYDGSTLVCIFCYHSLISQYLAYEMSPCQEDVNRWQRTYNIYNYICYICGITTYRQRACSISVRDFPFLSEHPRPPGSLTLLGGESVVTCLTCFESLTSQWKDFERMKVPVTLRKYNWMVFPPPANDEKNRGQLMLGHDGTSEGNQPDHRSEVDDSGPPHSTKPPPHVPVQTLYTSKPSSHAVAAPQSSGHVSSSSYGSYESGSSALNAIRTSSFAAALRKLAKQAVDPITERDGSPSVPGQQAVSSTRGHGSGVNYNSNSGHMPSQSNAASPPSISTSVYEAEKRKAAEYVRYSAAENQGNEPVNFKSLDYSKHGNIHDDQRPDSGQDTKRSPLYAPVAQFRDEHSSLSHGFQPYRNVEESPMSSQARDQSSAAMNPYHRSLYPPSSSSQSYRLDESMCFERYGLLRPPAVSFSPSTNGIPYPGMPFYPSSHRYPPGLLAQASTSSLTHNPTASIKREKSEDSYRENEFPRHREKHLMQDVERGAYQARERAYREADAENAEEKGGRIYSPLSLQINSRTGSPVNETGRMESGTYGNSHDLLIRKHSPLSSSSSSTPLNLVKHVPSNSEELERWKRQEQYAANRHAYRGFSYPKNGFDGAFEHKFHPHPPPLISEVSQDFPNSRNIQKTDDMSSRNLPFQMKPSSYPPREYPRTLPEDAFPNRSMHVSQLNGTGAIFHESYDHRPGSYNNQHNYRETANHSMPEDWTKSKVQVKNGTVPEVWTRSSYPSEKMHQQDSSSVPFDGTLEQDPHYAFKEASITRALLQNQITPSVIERYVHAAEEPQPTSKLDQRETKLRKLRFSTGNLECELSDSESEDEQDQKLKEFLVVKKGPPMEFKVSPQKLGFFKTVGLTTRPKRQYLEWKKYMKRREMLRDKSISPVMEEMKDAVTYDDDHLAQLSKRLCVEDNSETKKDFLKLLGLEKASSDVNKSELIDPVEEKSVENAASTDTSTETTTNEYHCKKRRSFLSIMNTNSMNNASSSNDSENGNNSQGKDEANSGIIGTHTLPFSKIISKAISASMPPLIPSGQSQSGLSIASKDPRAKYLDRSFAQEFHESVLQVTQLQLGQKKTSSDESLPASSKQSLACEEIPCLPFRWPGIEAIMEAYDTHITEQNVEKDFLIDQLQLLQARNQDLNTQLVCLGQKTSELSQKKGCLEIEKVQLQASVDSLRKVFQIWR